MLVLVLVLVLALALVLVLALQESPGLGALSSCCFPGTERSKSVPHLAHMSDARPPKLPVPRCRLQEIQSVAGKAAPRQELLDRLVRGPSLRCHPSRLPARLLGWHACPLAKHVRVILPAPSVSLRDGPA